MSIIGAKNEKQSEPTAGSAVMRKKNRLLKILDVLKTHEGITAEGLSQMFYLLHQNWQRQWYNRRELPV